MQKFNRRGLFLEQWGSSGSGDGQFWGTGGLCLDLDGSLFVGDIGNHRIVKLAPNGQQITAWGTFGAGDGEFNRPFAVAVAKDGSGDVYVVDA